MMKKKKSRHGNKACTSNQAQKQKKDRHQTQPNLQTIHTQYQAIENTQDNLPNAGGERLAEFMLSGMSRKGESERR